MADKQSINCYEGKLRILQYEFPFFKQAKNKKALSKTVVEILEARYLVTLMKLQLTNARANVTIPLVILFNLKEPNKKYKFNWI